MKSLTCCVNSAICQSLLDINVDFDISIQEETGKQSGIIHFVSSWNWNYKDWHGEICENDRDIPIWSTIAVHVLNSHQSPINVPNLSVWSHTRTVQPRRICTRRINGEIRQRRDQEVNAQMKRMATWNSGSGYFSYEKLHNKKLQNNCRNQEIRILALIITNNRQFII